MKKFATLFGFFTLTLVLALSVNAESLEYKLATLDGGGFRPKSELTVARFRSLLAQLSRKYDETEERIAEMTFSGQELLKKDGIEEKLLNIMEGMNLLLPRKMENQKYAEYVAMYAVLRQSSQPHREAILNLRALLERIRGF